MSILPRLVRAIAVASLVAPLAAQLTVVSVAPANNAVSAPTATTVTVVFSAPVERATVTAATCRLFGRWSGVVAGSFAFSNSDRTVTFTPSRPLFPGETVALSISRAVAAAGGGNLARGFSSWFWTRPARGSGTFSLAATLRVRLPTETARIRTYGAYAGDLNRDGAPDFTLPNEESNDVRVMLNDGCGSFSPPAVYPLRAQSVPSPNEGADFDADGITDVAIANTQGSSISVLLGNGDGTFRPAAHYPSGVGTRGITVLDVDGDGDDDIVTANRSTSNLALHRNRGNGTFDAATFLDGGGSGETAVMAGDANGDGIGDLFVGHLTSNTVTLLLGDGSGGFALSATRAVGSRPWMIVVGDVDGDGAADAAVCNSSSSSVSVVRGDGAGGLLAATTWAAGSFPLAIDLGDIDGDGDLDLAASNYSSADYTVRLNDGGGGFASWFRLTTPAAGSCMLVVDYDRDGDMDLIAIDELDDLVHLYRQTGPSPSQVQAPACGATLRVDNLANRGGYGAATTHGVRPGTTLFLGVTGTPSQSAAILFGDAQQAGSTTPFGLLNLDLSAGLSPILLATDAHGETQLALPIPAAVPPGVAFAAQAVVVDPAHASGLRLSNPERFASQ